MKIHKSISETVRMLLGALMESGNEGAPALAMPGTYHGRPATIVAAHDDNGASALRGRRGKTLAGIHTPTLAELEDLFRPPVIVLAIASIRDETLDEDDGRGCWHYGYDGRYCVMCDPDTYEPTIDEDGGEA